MHLKPKVLLQLVRRFSKQNYEEDQQFPKSISSEIILEKASFRVKIPQRDIFSRHNLGSSKTDSISRRGVLLVKQEEENRFEEVRRKEIAKEIFGEGKEGAKEIEDIFGEGKDGSSRCSKKGERNCKNTEEQASFKNGANGGENPEGIPMSSRIAQNLTTPRGPQNVLTPRGHGRRDGETKQVNFSKLLSTIIIMLIKVIHMLILIMAVFFLCWTPILIYNLLAAFELMGQVTPYQVPQPPDTCIRLLQSLVKEPKLITSSNPEITRPNGLFVKNHCNNATYLLQTTITK